VPLIPDQILKKLLQHSDRLKAEAATPMHVPDRVVAPKNVFQENMRDVTEAVLHQQHDLATLKTTVTALSAEEAKRTKDAQEALKEERVTTKFLVRVLAAVIISQFVGLILLISFMVGIIVYNMRI